MSSGGRRARRDAAADDADARSTDGAVEGFTDDIARKTSQLGEAIRAARLRVGISQRDLAHRLSLSPGMISQLEKGQSQPSVTTLIALATVLEVSLDSLFNTDEDVPVTTNGEPLPSQVSTVSGKEGGRALPRPLTRRIEGLRTRPGERAVVQMPQGVTWELLTADQDHPVLFMIVSYPPGSTTNPEGDFVRHMDTEYFYLTDGVLDVYVEFEHLTLSAGDAMWFDSTRPHRFVNVGEVEARGVWCLLPQGGPAAVPSTHGSP